MVVRVSYACNLIKIWNEIFEAKSTVCFNKMKHERIFFTALCIAPRSVHSQIFPAQVNDFDAETEAVHACYNCRDFG